MNIILIIDLWREKILVTVALIRDAKKIRIKSTIDMKWIVFFFFKDEVNSLMISQ